MNRQRFEPGQAGLARKGRSPLQAYWVENMDLEADGVWRPRWGLQWIGTFSGTVTHISRPSGYNNHVMCIAESGKLIDVPTENFAGRTTVDTGWPTTPVVSTFGITTSGTNLWCAHKAGVGQTAGALKLYNNAALNNPTTPPRDGNYVFSHDNMLVSLLSGVGDNTAMAHATRGDANDWPTARKKTPIPICGTTDAGVPLDATMSLVFGPSGIGYIGGPDDFTNTRWKGRSNTPITTPMHHVLKAGSFGVFFLKPGPSCCLFDPSGGGERNLEPPLGQDLWLPTDVNLIRTWYDGLRDEIVIWDQTSYWGWRYSLRLQRFVGVHSYGAASTNLLGQAYIDQGASAADSSKYPWGKGFLGAGARLVTWDHSLYTDQTGSGTSSTFTCAIETAPFVGDEPELEKQITRLHFEAAGTASAIKLKYRNDPDGAWTTVTLASNVNLSTTKVIYPSSLPQFREAVIRVEWASASTVRFRSVQVELMNVAAI